MGSFWSQPSYTVPDPVNVDEVLNIKPGEARRNILNNLQQYGFLIVRETEEGVLQSSDNTSHFTLLKILSLLTSLVN
tara:strand:+ start:255 stop:485 length:231 start_codon:yes stop_codon:yes gene_type:complete